MAYPGTAQIGSTIAAIRAGLTALGGAPTPTPTPTPGEPISPTAFSIGQNVVFNPRAAAAFTNLATDAYWQGPQWSGSSDGFYYAGDPGFDERGDIRGMGLIGGAMNLRDLQSPSVQGLLTEVSWREPNNTSGVSNWDVYPKTFPEGINWGNVSAITYSGGRYRIRGIYNTSQTNPNDSGALELYGKSSSNDFVDIQIGEVGVDFSQELRSTYINRTLNPPRGELRMMEVQKINDARQNYLWADRPKLTSPRYGIYRMNGFSLETMLDMANLSGRPPSFIIGYRWPKETVQAFVRGIFRGTDMEGGRKLAAYLYASLSLCGNEPWNPTFPIYHMCVADGKLLFQPDANGDYGINVKMRKYRSNQVYDWIVEAVPEALDRIVFTFSGHPGVHAVDYFDIQIPGQPLRGIQAVETSIYPGIGVKNNSYGGNTPAELSGPWNTDTDNQIAASLDRYDAYTAAGIQRKQYEYGEDMQNSVLSEVQRDTWVNSPQFKAMKKRGLFKIAEKFGPISVYWDTGTHTDWAHQQRAGFPSPKWDALLEVQAELAAAAAG